MPPMPDPKPKRIPRNVTVRRVADLGPHFRRVTLGGPELAGFPDDSHGSYIKLLIPKATPPETQAVGADSSEAEHFVRTYTVRHHRPGDLELDLDIVLHTTGENTHAQPGPGAAWAASAAPGDAIALTGPGNATFADPAADWFLFLGDLSAYPAICANLERLPQDARGTVLIETPGPLEGLPPREHFDFRWVAPADDPAESALAAAARALPWREGRPFVWAAAEFDQMKQLRHHFKRERRLTSNDLYISSYWKQGLPEEAHKQVKRADAEMSV